jgi:hypothetical protein
MALSKEANQLVLDTLAMIEEYPHHFNMEHFISYPDMNGSVTQLDRLKALPSSPSEFVSGTTMCFAGWLTYVHHHKYGPSNTGTIWIGYHAAALLGVSSDEGHGSDHDKLMSLFYLSYSQIESVEDLREMLDNCGLVVV